MLETIIQYTIGFVNVFVDYTAIFVAAAIYVAHPVSTIIILAGPFAIPIIYTLYLCIEENIRTAIRFFIIAFAILATNYSIGYLSQILRATRGKRRGVDLTMLFYSMTGLIISITLVVIWIIILGKKERARERSLIIVVAQKSVSSRGQS